MDREALLVFILIVDDRSAEGSVDRFIDLGVKGGPRRSMLVIVEPLILHRSMDQAIQQPDSAWLFDRMERFHQIMLAVSLVIGFGAVAGSHGLF